MKYLLILTLFLISCGDPEIVLDNNVFEPKIVIDGYLITGQPVERIFIKENIPSGTSLNTLNLFVDDAEVYITDLSTNNRVQLTYDNDPFTLSYYDEFGALGIVKHNTEYRIEVRATIKGEELTASSVTRTPSTGFAIHPTADTTKVYPRNDDERDNNKFNITFDKAEGAEIYIFQHVPLDKRYETLIQTPRNIFLNEEITREDFEDEKDGFESSGEIVNLKSDTPEYTREINWFRFHFASRYRTTVIAGDENYKDFYMTFNQVQDIDGNIDEPNFNIDGDGIGIFGSATIDTIYLNIEL